MTCNEYTNPNRWPLIGEMSLTKNPGWEFLFLKNWSPAMGVGDQSASLNVVEHEWIGLISRHPEYGRAF